MPAPSTAPAAIPGTAAIRCGVAFIGAIAFALSYDALRQMAAAAHITDPLTYAFPFVIDGFIAIGIGALLILRTAPLPSRLYVWTLIGIATVSSIWANALHAIRLNQQTRHNAGLHLGNLTVGALSATAPLALAGAVHLYLVIRRHAPVDIDATKRRDSYRHNGDRTVHQRPAPAASASGRRQAEPEKGSDAAEPAAGVADAPDPLATTRGRQPSATMDELLAIGRNAPRGRDGRISRRAVEAAIRHKGHSVGKDRLAEATRLLQAEADTPTPMPTPTPTRTPGPTPPEAVQQHP